MTKVYLKEGGNAFKGTVRFDQSNIPEILETLNQVLSETGIELLPIGSGATPTPGKLAGDLDVIADQNLLAEHFGVTDSKDIKTAIEQKFQEAGYETRKIGINVHVNYPLKEGNAQVDIMIVPHAKEVSKFHTHSIPEGSVYKGKNKQLAIWWLAKEAGYNWSAFKGLINEDSKEVVTRDLNEIANLLIGPAASSADLGSVESIMRAMSDKYATIMLSELKKNDQWEELPLTEVNRIKELAGM